MPYKEDGMGTILGIIVNIFSMISDISQIFHTVNHQSVEGISIISIICDIIIGIFFLLYGIHLDLLMVIILNCSYLICVSVLLYFWVLNYCRRNNNNYEIITTNV